MLLPFKCPSCGGTKLEEVMVDVTVTTTIKTVGEGGDLSYGECSHEEGEVLQYQCQTCGHVLKDQGGIIRTSEALSDYLKQNDPEAAR